MSERELAVVDTTFLYTGPNSGVTLKLPNGGVREVLLHNGRLVDLPADHPFVVRLVAQQYLTDATPPAAAEQKPSVTPTSSSRPPRPKASAQEDSK